MIQEKAFLYFLCLLKKPEPKREWVYVCGGVCVCVGVWVWVCVCVCPELYFTNISILKNKVQQCEGRGGFILTNRL